jgi:hypothetical protein
VAGERGKDEAGGVEVSTIICFYQFAALRWASKLLVFRDGVLSVVLQSSVDRSLLLHVAVVAGGRFHHRVALVAGSLGVRQTRSNTVPHHLPCDYRFYMGHDMGSLRPSAASVMGSQRTNIMELASTG